jgi:hypothetical protein
VYLNGTKLDQKPMHDCNDGAFGACFWTNAGKLSVSSSAILANPAVNTLTFLVANVPTGYPSLVSPYPGGPAPQFGCVFRNPQPTGSHLFTNDQAVTTTAGHVGPAPTGPGHPMDPPPTENVANPGQDGCENPTGLAFAGTVTWTVQTTLQWCSPGFWKNHLNAWSLADQQKLYSTLGSGAAPLSKKAPAGDPNLVTVISNPNTYGGPATNSVADYLSGIAFGSAVGTSANDNNCNNGIPLNPRS